MNWNSLAQNLQDYAPGGPWERMLDRHMRRFFPQVVQEFESQGQYQSYLRVRTAAAEQMVEDMEESGVPPMYARDEALRELMPTPTDELELPTRWELEGAMHGAASLAGDFLAKRA